MRKDLIIIGRVLRPHGVNGEIRIEYFNPEDPLFFSRYHTIYLQQEGELPRPYRPIKVRPHTKVVLASLEGVQTREEAERLRGSWVLVESTHLPPLKEDEYYWHEIVGMRVMTEQGVIVGEVTEIFPTGSNDVYVVHKDAQEILIPAIEDVIVAIDRTTRTIYIRPPEGFLKDDDL